MIRDHVAWSDSVSDITVVFAEPSTGPDSDGNGFGCGVDNDYGTESGDGFGDTYTTESGDGLGDGHGDGRGDGRGLSELHQFFFTRYYVKMAIGLASFGDGSVQYPVAGCYAPTDSIFAAAIYAAFTTGQHDHHTSTKESTE